MNAFHQQYRTLSPILRAVKREALSTKFQELNSDLKSFIWQIINSRTPETRCEILPGHSENIRQSPINGNSHIRNEHKSLGGLKTNFNFDVTHQVHLSITTFTSLKNEIDYLKNTKVPRIWKKPLHSKAALDFHEELTKKEMVRFSCLNTLWNLKWEQHGFLISSRWNE